MASWLQTSQAHGPCIKWAEMGMNSGGSASVGRRDCVSLVVNLIVKLETFSAGAEEAGTSFRRQLTG